MNEGQHGMGKHGDATHALAPQARFRSLAHICMTPMKTTLAVIMLATACTALYGGSARGEVPEPPNLASIHPKASDEPPFFATTYFEPDLITPSDPTAWLDARYLGRCERWLFDRRVGQIRHEDAYCFEASFDDGLSAEVLVNPELASVSEARTAATYYARMLGRLPRFLRLYVYRVEIHQGAQAWSATPCNSETLFLGTPCTIHVHTGFGPGFETSREEAMVHEAGHASLESEHQEAPGWRSAQREDGNFISDYARDNPDREDIAETIVAWLAVRHRSGRLSEADEDKILDAVPHRLAYFDRHVPAGSLSQHLYPFVGERVTASLPLVLAADRARHSFVRLRNLSARDSVVTVHAVDDAGALHGPLTLDVAAHHTVGFNSYDLQSGNPARGLRGGAGEGEGHWRLLFAADFPIETRSYVRTDDGLLTSMHVLARGDASATAYDVPFFNPASNRSHWSLLRIANPNPRRVQVTIEAWDSHNAAAEEAVELRIDAEAAVFLSSQQLEAGDPEAFSGRFGDGAGKWRLRVRGEDLPLEVMSLLSTRSGHLVNLSR